MLTKTILDTNREEAYTRKGGAVQISGSVPLGNINVSRLTKTAA